MTCPLDNDSIVLLLDHKHPYSHKTGTAYRFLSCRHQYCIVTVTGTILLHVCTWVLGLLPWCINTPCHFDLKWFQDWEYAVWVKKQHTHSTQSCSPWPCSSKRMHLLDQHSGPADKKWWMQIVLWLTLSSVYGDLVAAGVYTSGTKRPWVMTTPTASSATYQWMPCMKTKFQSSIKLLRNCFFISVSNYMTKGAISLPLLIY